MGVDMCGECVFVCEGELDLTGVSEAGRSGSPEQRTPDTATGTPWAGMALTRKPCHLEEGSIGARSISSPSPD